MEEFFKDYFQQMDELEVKKEQIIEKTEVLKQKIQVFDKNNAGLRVSLTEKYKKYQRHPNIQRQDKIEGAENVVTTNKLHKLLERCQEEKMKQCKVI